jgi:hypothetical protein
LIKEMANSQTILNHYVPRFYLRNFSIHGNCKSVWCFDKIIGKKFKISISNIGCEKGFYNQEIEQYLSGIEGKASPVLKKVIEGKSLQGIVWAERELLALYIAIQDNRTFELRDLVEPIGKWALEKIIESLPKEIRVKTPEKDLNEYVNSKAKDFAIQTQRRLLKESTKQFSDMLLTLQWILLENTTETPLWTSDNPVIKFNPLNGPQFSGNLGYLSPGIEIFFPLTPTLCLSLCDIRKHKLVVSERITMNNTEYVTYQNHLAFDWSYRHIFSNEETFSRIEEMKKSSTSKEDRVKIN